LCFSDLEEIVSNALLQLLALIPCNGWIVTSELSFKKKVDMMASLVRRRGSTLETTLRSRYWMSWSRSCFRLRNFTIG